MEKLEGKVAVITGAASGIGRAVALRAAGEGMKVVLADIEEGPLKEAESEVSRRGTETIAVVADVSDGTSVRGRLDRGAVFRLQGTDRKEPDRPQAREVAPC